MDLLLVTDDKGNSTNTLTTGQVPYDVAAELVSYKVLPDVWQSASATQAQRYGIRSSVHMQKEMGSHQPERAFCCDGLRDWLGVSSQPPL